MQNTLKATLASLALVAVSITSVVGYHTAVKASDLRLGYGAAAVTASDITIPTYGYVWTGDGGESELEFASLGGQAAIY